MSVVLGIFYNRKKMLEKSVCIDFIFELNSTPKSGMKCLSNSMILFLAFLKPIINSKGYAFKEPEVSEERRMDIAVTFFQHQYIIELKMWRGNVAHKKGLVQLDDYLDRQHQHQHQGFMVIFEQNVEKNLEKRMDSGEWEKGVCGVGVMVFVKKY